MTPTSSSRSGRRSPDLGDEPFFLVLHRTPGRVSCFLSDRAPRRDLTGPARPAGLRGECPPASACGGCLLLYFAPKACRSRRAADRGLGGEPDVLHFIVDRPASRERVRRRMEGTSVGKEGVGNVELGGGAGEK